MNDGCPSDPKSPPNSRHFLMLESHSPSWSCPSCPLSNQLNPFQQSTPPSTLSSGTICCSCHSQARSILWTCCGSLHSLYHPLILSSRISACSSTHPQAKLPISIAYALHRTKLHQAVTFTALILLQRLKARFPTASGSSMVLDP